MSDAAAALQIAISALFCAVSGALAASFAGAFALPRRTARGWPRRTRLWFVLCYAFLWCVVLDRWEIPPDAPNVTLFKQAVCFLLRAALIFLFYRVNLGALLFLSVMFAAVSDVCLFLANEWLHFVTGQLDLFLAWFEAGRIDETAYLRLIQGVTQAALFLFQSLYTLFLALALRLVVRFFDSAAGRQDAAGRAESLRGLRPDELAFLLFPALAGWIVCLMLRLMMIHVENGVYYTLYERQPVMLVMVPSVCLLLLAAMVAGVRVFSVNRRAARERSDRLILAHQVSALQEQIAATEAQTAVLRGLRHDMKNHVAVLSALQKSGQEKALADYLSGLSEALVGTEAPFHTGHAVADALLAMKREAAVREDPSLVFDAAAFLLPKDLRIEGFALGVLLANALDNAVEACERLRAACPDRERFIRLRSRPRGETVFLEMENSFDGMLRLRPDGLPASLKGAEGARDVPAPKKAAEGAHGLGMENIRRIVGQNHGGMEFAAADDVFTLTIMLQRSV